MQELSSRRRFLKKAAFAGGGALLGTVGLSQISPRIWREPLEFEPNRSYWARSQPLQNLPLKEDIAVDVAVLGGGFTGLSAAYYIRSISPRSGEASHVSQQFEKLKREDQEAIIEFLKSL